MKNWENGNRFNLDTVIKLLKLSKAKIFAKKKYSIAFRLSIFSVNIP